LLRGHIRCATCGHRMSTRILKRRNLRIPYYYCANRRNKFIQCPDIPVVRADLLDPLVWEQCCILFERLEAVQARLEAEVDKSLQNYLEDTHGKAQLIELEAAVERARLERTKHEEGSYLYNLVTEDIRVKTEQLEKYKVEHASAKDFAALQALYRQRVLGFFTFLNVMRGKYGQATWQEKRNALDVLGVSVTYTPRRPEERQRGKDATFEEVRSRMDITYSPIFSGVSSTATELWQDLREVTRKIRPDWDLSKPGLRENYEGDKTLHYPYKAAQ
jgi:hypothetical protein